MRTLTRFAISLSALLCCLQSGLARAEDADPSSEAKLKLRRSIRATTARVTADFRDGTSSLGTGVATMVCGQNRQIKLIVTNAHVVTSVDKSTGERNIAPAVTAEAWSEDHKGAKLDASVLYCEMSGDGTKDLAYLIVEDPDGAFTVAERASGRPRTGDEVLACGNPLGEYFFIDDGKVLDGTNLGLGSEEAERTLCHDALIERGNSGGGLFNVRGELVGINTWLMNGKVGVAQTVDWFFANHHLEHFHGALTGARDMTFFDYITPGQAIRAAVVGTYRCEPKGEWMNGAGVEGKLDKRRDKKFPFGAIIMTIGDEKRSFNGALKGSDGRLVTNPRVAICEESRACGRIEFQVNDDNPFDNEWGKEFEVVYLVRGPRQSSIGIEFAAPTEKESLQHDLWVPGYDASNKPKRFAGGARVTKVTPGSEADAAGLRVGDFIIGLRQATGQDSDPRDRNAWKGLMMTMGEPVDATNLDTVLAWARQTYHKMMSHTKLTVIRPGGQPDPINGRYLLLDLEFGVFKK